MKNIYGVVFSSLGLAVLLAALLQYQTGLFALSVILAALGVYEMFGVKSYKYKASEENTFTQNPSLVPAKFLKKIVRLARKHSKLTVKNLEQKFGLSNSNSLAFLEHLVYLNKLSRVNEEGRSIYYPKHK